MRLVKNHAGFTLVEALVALTTTTVIVLVISSYMLQNTQQSTFATTKQDILRETQQSLDVAANDVRLSANADTNNRWPDNYSPGGSGNLYGWESSASTLVLATAAQNTSGVILFQDAQNYVTYKNNVVYFISSGTLYKRTLAANIANNADKTSCPKAHITSSCPADKELLHNVTNFTVTYLNGQSQAVEPTSARSIELNVTVSKKVYSQQVSADYKTRMVFRND